MGGLTVERLLSSLKEKLELAVVTESAASRAGITSSDVARPGLLLAGFSVGSHDDRIQVLGRPEMAYLDSLDERGLAEALDRICVPTVPCIIVTDGREAPPRLIALGNERGIPVMTSPLSCTQLARELASFVEEALAPRTTVHGTLVDVYGVGLLVTGESGIGKSECGLDLVESGHRLVADDVVYVRRTPRGRLVGAPSELLKHHMEIRGVGIIDVRSIFGVRAVRSMKRIEVEVRLVKWSDVADYERLGIEETTTEILGVEVPLVTLPLVIGKNITVIAEVIAQNHLLKLSGVSPAVDFDRRLRDLVSRNHDETDAIDGESE